MIKMSQYGDLVKLPSYLKPKVEVPDKEVEKEKPAEQPQEKQDSVELHQQAESPKTGKEALSSAFDKAKEIIEAAEAYKVSTIKEATEKMNEECSKLKIKSREEGFALGKLEGKKQGEQEGYKLGYNDGLEKAEKENELVVAELERLISDVQDAKNFIVKKYEDDLQTLAVAIAKKIVRSELSTNEDALANIIRGAVEDYHNQEWVTVTVSQNMADRLKKYDKSLIDDLKQVAGDVKIVASQTSEDDGDCFIEMPDVAIDASVDSQFKEIEKSIT